MKLLRSFLDRWRGRAPSAAPTPRQVRPMLEALEDRLVPAGSMYADANGVIHIFGEDNTKDIVEVVYNANGTVGVTMHQYNLNNQLIGQPLVAEYIGVIPRVEFHGYGGNDAFANATSLIAHVWGGAGNDYLYGGSSGDILRGEAGNDELRGLGGSDILYGGLGDDFLAGGDGHNQLYGGLGKDRLYGGSGNDRIDGGFDTANDYLSGGSGADTFVRHLFPHPIVPWTQYDYFPDFSLAQGDALQNVYHGGTTFGVSEGVGGMALL